MEDVLYVVGFLMHTQSSERWGGGGSRCSCPISGRHLPLVHCWSVSLLSLALGHGALL